MTILTVCNIYIIGSHCNVVRLTPANAMFSPMFLNDVADFHAIIMNSVQLRKEAPKRETSKCIFCCKSGPRGNDKKLSSTPDGQSNVITSSGKLKDNLLHGLTKEEINDIKYHTRSCYGPYVLRGSRVPTEAVVVQVAESPEQQAGTPVLRTREARNIWTN